MQESEFSPEVEAVLIKYENVTQEWDELIQHDWVPIHQGTRNALRKCIREIRDAAIKPSGADTLTGTADKGNERDDD